MTWRLAGRVAVVTGASSGLGHAIADRLAREGMVVVAVARRGDRLDALATTHEHVHPYVADVTDTAQVDGLAAWVTAELGACHALVNNAGVTGRPFETRADLDDALRTVDVNLGGTLRCTAAFADLLAASAPSRVVNIGSVNGKIGLGPAGYVASKFGTVGFSEALSFSWASRGVTVCELNPGYIVTEGFTQRHLRGTLFERVLGEPSIVADAVVDVLARGRVEATVPRFYRVFVVLRHLVPPLFRRIAARDARASGRRE